MVARANKIPVAEIMKITRPAGLVMVGFKATLGGESAGFCNGSDDQGVHKTINKIGRDVEASTLHAFFVGVSKMATLLPHKIHQRT